MKMKMGAPRKVANGVRRSLLISKDCWDEAQRWQFTLRLPSRADGLRAMLRTAVGLEPVKEMPPAANLDEGDGRQPSQPDRSVES